MRVAIKPKGIGRAPGFRMIQDHWALAGEETFSVDASQFTEGMVLAEDQISLRAKTKGDEVRDQAEAAHKAALKTLVSIDQASVRSIREWIASQVTAPQPLKDLEVLATTERGKLLEATP